ncbi:salicylate synthase [Actinoallomurus sp. NPDC050550]|uniref:salicylate synthase n=1 Tax=Actinoallomurus sp. NPDC050550 TaxID=3154937 RepID=UPI0033D62CFE
MAGDRKYHERTVAPVPEPLAAVRRLAGEGRADYFCYEGPDGFAVAADPVAELVADRSRLLLRGPDGDEERPWSAEALRRVPALLDEVPLEAWRCYGWAGFDLAAARDGLTGLVGDEPFLHLMIPRTEVRFHTSGTLLRALDPGDLDALQERVETAPPPAAPARPGAVPDRDAGAYLNAVEKAVRYIRDGRLQKVILSRTVPVGFPVDLVASYELGRRANSPARSHLFSLGGLASAGFSPETVVEVSKEGAVTTQPVAGTRARTGEPARDAELRYELLNDAKEGFEHALSFKIAVEEMAELCPDHPVLVGEFMAVRDRGSVQHLASTVGGTLTAPAHAWDAFAALFPAVTTSGAPKQAAYEVIHELETSGRGPYGGAVLTYDADGTMDAAVVLRTVFQRDGRAWLRAGAGIVAQSRPERELTETREKLASIAHYLVPQAG